MDAATSAYATARAALVQHLLEDAAAHEAGRVDAVGWRFDASDLAGDRQITNPRVLERFDIAANPALGGRVQTLAARLRAVPSGSA